MTVAPANEVRFAAGPWSPSGQPSRHSVDTGGRGRRTSAKVGPSKMGRRRWNRRTAQNSNSAQIVNPRMQQRRASDPTQKKSRH
jgi:hypothetical protein